MALGLGDFLEDGPRDANRLGRCIYRPADDEIICAGRDCESRRGLARLIVFLSNFGSGPNSAVQEQKLRIQTLPQIASFLCGAYDSV